MTRALDSLDEGMLPDDQRTAIWDHMVRAADMLINSNPDPHQRD